ncbi:MepB protein [Leptospira kemamanensis]|uniref:MepB protein n=1 Tax=Leptospira kemamanensis TaxID=2484942 RepID=A0A4R9JTJ1_9LEPT|nr:MepB protein [Leptospira kemamanensis]
MIKTVKLPLFLKQIDTLLSKYSHLQIKNVQIEKESLEYNATVLDLDSKKAIFRKAKITPKKMGFFVTLWKRNKYGVTTPFEKKDEFDFVIVEVNQLGKTGHFIFNKNILMEKGIISHLKNGKRGFRIYPTWDVPSNKQAVNSQIWQSQYFFEHKKMNSQTNSRLQEILR